LTELLIELSRKDRNYKLMPRAKRIRFKTKDGRTVSFNANPGGRRRRRRVSRAEFRAEHISRKRRGEQVRTISPGDGRHRVRIAFPSGPRRRGAGRVLEILHPRGENPGCAVNPASLEKSFPKELEGAKVLITIPTRKKKEKAIARNPGPGELVILGLGNPKRRKHRRARNQRKWIAGAIHRPGSLRAAAERAGALTARGTIDRGWLEQQAKKGSAHVAQAARLALRLRTFNPDELDQAADLYREFHGKEPGEVLKLQQQMELRKDYAALGPLLELRGSVGSSRWEIAFDRDKPMLASSPDGRQLYILGGDQNVDSCLGQLETDADRDFVDLGKLSRVVYFARKQQANFDPVEWMHDFEDPLPRIHYDRLNRQLAIVGGAYYIEAPGIID
jgi:hypothetical protein